MNPVLYLETIGKLLTDKRYAVALWKKPWLVLQKDASGDKDVDKIEMQLQVLAVEWQ
jgi:hypothetical protein